MTKSDAELLAEAIKAVIRKDDPALQALLEDLLDMEQQVAHMARPHRILPTLKRKRKRIWGWSDGPPHAVQGGELQALQRGTHPSPLTRGAHHGDRR